MLSQEKNPTTWWGFLSPLPGPPPPPTPLIQIAVSPCSFFFFFSRCSCSPSVVTWGPFDSAPLFLDGQGSVPGGADRQAVVSCRSAPVRLTWRQFARWHCCACLRLGLHLGGRAGGGGGWGRGWGRQAGWQGRKEKGFTTLKRVGIPPEPFPHLAGSCENNWLAYTLTACRWISSYESALRSASGRESGGLVRNINMLKKGTGFWILLLQFSCFSLSLSSTLVVVHRIAMFTFVLRGGANEALFVSSFHSVDLRKMLCWCLELRDFNLTLPLLSVCYSTPGWLSISHWAPTPAAVSATSVPFPPPYPHLQLPWRRS